MVQISPRLQGLPPTMAKFTRTHKKSGQATGWSSYITSGHPRMPWLPHNTDSLKSSEKGFFKLTISDGDTAE